MQSPNAVWTYEISKHIGKENLMFVNDITRMASLQLVIQMMMHVTDPDRYNFLDADFIVLVLFIVVAVSAYWLVLRRLINFE